MRENRTYGSEGGEALPSRPLSWEIARCVSSNSAHLFECRVYNAGLGSIAGDQR